jgi:hypothetical protein
MEAPAVVNDQPAASSLVSIRVLSVTPARAGKLFAFAVSLR